jgi:hypothetical protein
MSAISDFRSFRRKMCNLPHPGLRSVRRQVQWSQLKAKEPFQGLKAPPEKGEKIKGMLRFNGQG